ncbi:hypothetical protein [Odoribacter laneus]|uniref:hypothetical protein n=1 Tax=Odoribacter laneus TaxID=626933 RepID=UPI0026580A1C|nr:hypothetical protein [Odoribacter laneus]
MDSEDSGPRRFIHLMFVLLVLLVQLDILECSAFRDQVKPVAKAYYSADEGKEDADEPRESYYYKVRPVFSAPRLFFSIVPEIVPAYLGTILSVETPSYFPLDNRHTHMICCVYLI